MLAPVLLAPFRIGDISGIALALLAIVGTFLALRNVRRPSLLQLIALLFIATLVSLATASPVQYDYHLQTAWLLMVPLVVLPPRQTWLAIPVIVVALALNVFDLATPSFGKGLDYQDLVMKEVDRRTTPDAKVWDGTGYALRRKPAYRYWFLPVGVRLMAQRGLIAAYDPRNDPPAAIVYDQRVQRWLEAFPNQQRYVAHHYLPLYRNLLLPGMSATVDAKPTRTVWRVPMTATYDLFAGERLPDLDRLPPFPYETLQLIVDGNAIPRGTRSIALDKGSRVELISAVPHRTGVVLVLHGIRKLGVAAEERFVF